jgi:hypothetical protein
VPSNPKSDPEYDAVHGPPSVAAEPVAIGFPQRGWVLVDQAWKPCTITAPASPVGNAGVEGRFTVACDDGTYEFPSVKDVRHGAKPADAPLTFAFGQAGGKRHQLVIRADKSLIVTPGGRIVGRYGGDEDGLKLAKAHFAKLEPEHAKKLADGAAAKSA